VHSLSPPLPLSFLAPPPLFPFFCSSGAGFDWHVCPPAAAVFPLYSACFCAGSRLAHVLRGLVARRCVTARAVARRRRGIKKACDTRGGGGCAEKCVRVGGDGWRASGTGEAERNRSEIITMGQSGGEGKGRMKE